MRYLSLLPIAILYATYAALPFLPKVKQSPYYYLILILPVLGNLIWITTAKRIADTRELYYYGILCDVIISLSFFLVPILVAKLPINTSGVIGLGLITVGIVCLKL